MIANTPFYSERFPTERLEFWASINRSLVYMDLEGILKKLETIDEFSDESGLSLLEFRNLIALKFICIGQPSHRNGNLVEYLDRLADFTRQSARWQNEIFVIEYFFFLYYAACREFEKAVEALSRFGDEIFGERLAEWDKFNSVWDAFTLDHYAAHVYAAWGKYDEAIEICDELIDLASNDEWTDNTITTLSEVEGVEFSEIFMEFISELQKMRERFKEEAEWRYLCITTLSIKPNEAGEFDGGTIYFNWLHDRADDPNPPDGEFDSWSYTLLHIWLPPVVLSEEELDFLRKQHE